MFGNPYPTAPEEKFTPEPYVAVDREDTILRAEDLKDGMVVLREEPYNYLLSRLPERNAELNFCRVTNIKVRKVPQQTTSGEPAGVYVGVSFVGVYEDGTIRGRTSDGPSFWVVKKDTIPDA